MAMVGVAVYVVVVGVLQLLPPHYDPIREAESNLAVGPFGWVMNVNFLGRTVTTVFAMLAIRRIGAASRLRRLGLVFFGIGGASSAVLAFFATDVADVSASAGAAASTAAGLVHLLVATTGFAAALIGILILTAWLRQQPDLRRTYRVALAFAVVAAGGAVWLALSATVLPGLVGLAERICLTGVLGWTFVVCAGIRRASPFRDHAPV